MLKNWLQPKYINKVTGAVAMPMYIENKNSTKQMMHYSFKSYPLIKDKKIEEKKTTPKSDNPILYFENIYQH